MFMWVGNCGHKLNPEKKGPIIVYPDETVGPIEDQWRFIREEFNHYEVTQDGSRMIAAAYSELLLEQTAHQAPLLTMCDNRTAMHERICGHLRRRCPNVV